MAINEPSTQIVEYEIAAAIVKSGYRRISRKQFQFLTDNIVVEHYLYVKYFGRYGRLWSIDFGMRNLSVEQISLDIIKKFGGSVYDYLLPMGKANCSMRFSLGKISGWPRRWSLLVTCDNIDQMLDVIGLSIDNIARPIAVDTNSLDSLLRLLVADTEPCGWSQVNGAIRAAQIVLLSKKCGCDRSIIFDRLQPFLGRIQASLQGGLGALEFVETVLSESEPLR